MKRDWRNFDLKTKTSSRIKRTSFVGQLSLIVIFYTLLAGFVRAIKVNKEIADFTKRQSKSWYFLEWYALSFICHDYRQKNDSFPPSILTLPFSFSLISHISKLPIERRYEDYSIGCYRDFSSLLGVNKGLPLDKSTVSNVIYLSSSMHSIF